MDDGASSFIIVKLVMAAIHAVTNKYINNYNILFKSL